MAISLLDVEKATGERRPDVVERALQVVEVFVQTRVHHALDGRVVEARAKLPEQPLGLVAMAADGRASERVKRLLRLSHTVANRARKIRIEQQEIGDVRRRRHVVLL